MQQCAANTQENLALEAARAASLATAATTRTEAAGKGPRNCRMCNMSKPAESFDPSAGRVYKNCCLSIGPDGKSCLEKARRR